jgi:hypothetical protein
VILPGLQSEILAVVEEIIQAGAVVLSADGTALTLLADTNYIILVSANTTINIAALTGFIQFVNVGTDNRTLTFTLGSKTLYDITGSGLTTVTLTGFTQAFIAPNPSVANTLRYQKPSQTLASDVSWSATANSSTNRVTWAAPSFTAPRSYTLADKDINFGDLPSVGTTNGNSLTGTRPIALGCTNTTVAGTDNVAIGCYSVTVPIFAISCTFENLRNDYTSPFAAVSFSGSGSLENVRFSGWVNSLIASTKFRKGYNVHGHKMRSVSAFGYTKASCVETEVNLFGVSTNSTAQLMYCAADPTKLPVVMAGTGFFMLLIAQHTVDVEAVADSGAYFRGQRLITTYVTGGAYTTSIQTIGTDTVVGTFTATIYASVNGAGSESTLGVSVANTAATGTVNWTAKLKGFLSYYD